MLKEQVAGQKQAVQQKDKELQAAQTKVVT
jgi:hypothetical protein